MEQLYGGIDLHANNSVIALLQENDKVVFEKRLPNDLNTILSHLAPYRDQIVGVVVESTYNWYWLVDGLMEKGYGVHLAHTAGMKQYEGLKYRNDHVDARHLAHLLRLGILPTGYIYPKSQRGLRDLLRKRAKLVRQKVDQMLIIQSTFTRHTGHAISANRVRQLKDSDIDERFEDIYVALGIKSNVAVQHCLETQIKQIEKVVTKCLKPVPEFALLKTVPGIGDILAMTIWLETGTLARFGCVGDFASYCRCVDSKHLSNDKRKGKGNVKNGNKYLAWAFLEAAHFAVRFDVQIKRYYQRKSAKSHQLVAIKAVAHKLARACYGMIRDRAPFERQRAFGF
jgi:transposase